MDPDHADLFADKIRRFMPVDVLSDVTVDEETALYEMASDMDAAYYEETGKCDLLVDAELLLNALANDGQLDPTLADIPSTSVPEFTSDLYEDMGGTLTSGTVDIQVTDEGGMIKVVATDAALIATMKEFSLTILPLAVGTMSQK